MSAHGGSQTQRVDKIDSFDPRIDGCPAAKGTLFRFIPAVGDPVLLIKMDDATDTNWASAGGGGGGGGMNTNFSNSVAATKNQDFGGFQLKDVADPTLAQDAATKNYADTSSAGKMNTDFSNGTVCTIPLNMVGNSISNVDGITVINTGVPGQNGTLSYLPAGYGDPGIYFIAHGDAAQSFPVGVFSQNSVGNGFSGNASFGSGDGSGTGNVLIKTGDASSLPAGPSGNITLLTGPVSLGGTQGTIRFQDGSLAGAINGYVWTLQDQATGAGAWAAAGGGGMATDFSNAIAAANDIDLGIHKLVNVVNPTANQDAATKLYVDTQVAGQMDPDFSNAQPSTVAIDLNAHKLVNVTDPTAAQDAATKNYVDNKHSTNVRAAVNPDTLGATDYGLFVDTSVGGVPYVVNMPAGVAGTVYNVKDIGNNAAANNITFTPNGGDTMEAGSDIVTNGGARQFQFFNGVWRIMGGVF